MYLHCDVGTFPLATRAGSSRVEFRKINNFNKNLHKSLCKLTIDIYPKMYYNKGIEKEREVHKMPQEILRVYDDELNPVGDFPIEAEAKCQLFCYYYGFIYRKVKIS